MAKSLRSQSQASMRRSASSGGVGRRRRRLRAARPGLRGRLDDQLRQPVAAAAVEPVGLRIFVDQPLELLLVLVEPGAGQRRRQMAERDGGDAALGLRGLAGIADDEGIDDRQRAGDDLGKAGLAQRDRLAGQPFQRAMGADMDEGMAAERLPQPQAEGEQRMARRQRRVVIVGAAVGGPAAIRRQRHGDVAEGARRGRGRRVRRDAVRPAQSPASAGTPAASTAASASGRQAGRRASDSPRRLRAPSPSVLRAMSSSDRAAIAESLQPR